MAHRRNLRVLLLALCVAGCATTPTSSVDAFAERSASNSFEVFNRGVDSSGLVLDVAHDPQTSPASCGAHALASIVTYWRGSGAVTGEALFATTPPANAASGYSMAELMTLARAQGLLTSAVRLNQSDLIHELEQGRPVLIPIRAPSVYVDARTLPGATVPVVSFVRGVVISRAAQISELTRIGLVNHYVVVVGYQDKRFVVVEPVMGYRTISFSRLERYRRGFTDAALVFSAGGPAVIAKSDAAPAR